MSTRSSIALLISTMVSSVLFGMGAVVVLSVPSLVPKAAYLLPAVIAASFALTPFIAWHLAPNLRARAVGIDERRRAQNRM